MNHLKTLIFMVVFLFGFKGITYSQVFFGGGLSFNSNSVFNTVGLTGKVGVWASDKIDLNGNITYYFTNKASFAFDIDAHYKLFNLGDKLYINPFAGINFTRMKDIEPNYTNNSLNLGISFRIPSEQYLYFIAPRWILDYKQFVVTIGAIL